MLLVLLARIEVLSAGTHRGLVITTPVTRL